MRTGRIHYLAPHSTSPPWFALPTFPLFFTLAFNNEYIFSSCSFWVFFGVFFHSSIWSSSHFVLLQFFPSLVSFHFVFAPQHAPVSRWLINPNCLAVSSPCYMLNSSTLYCIRAAVFISLLYWKLEATLFWWKNINRSWPDSTCINQH